MADINKDHIKKQTDNAKSPENAVGSTEKAGVPLEDEQLDKVAGGDIQSGEIRYIDSEAVAL